MLNFQMVQQYSFSKKLLSLPIITGYYLNFIIGYSWKEANYNLITIFNLHKFLTWAQKICIENKTEEYKYHNSLPSIFEPLSHPLPKNCLTPEHPPPHKNIFLTPGHAIFFDHDAFMKILGNVFFLRSNFFSILVEFSNIFELKFNIDFFNIMIYVSCSNFSKQIFFNALFIMNTNNFTLIIQMQVFIFWPFWPYQSWTPKLSCRKTLNNLQENNFSF